MNIKDTMLIAKNLIFLWSGPSMPTATLIPRSGSSSSSPVVVALVSSSSSGGSSHCQEVVNYIRKDSILSVLPRSEKIQGLMKKTSSKKNRQAYELKIDATMWDVPIKS